MATTGKIPGGHGWSEAHKIYNAEVEKLWRNFLKDRGICPTQMGVTAADEFIGKIKKSRVKAVKAFNWAIENLINNAALSELANAVPTSTLGVKFSKEPIAVLDLLMQMSKY